MQTPTVVRPGSLTADQLASYERAGYLVLEQLLDDADMAPARQAMTQKVSMIADALHADGLIRDKLVDEPFPTRLARLFADLTDREFLRYGRSWRDRLPGYFGLMSNPKIVDVIESLLGPEIFANPVYNVRPKVPKVAAGIVPWHQDKSYWPDANARPVITVWIPLVDATHENGCLRVIPGTHRRRVLSYHNETYSGTGYTELDDQHIKPHQKEVVALPIKAGGAIVFNDRLIHSSTANSSGHVRWSVDLRYQPTNQDPMPQHGIGYLVRSRHASRTRRHAGRLAGGPTGALQRMKENMTDEQRFDIGQFGAELRHLLVVAAHPDDLETACGGTIVLLIAGGVEVSLLLCTQGDIGTHDPAHRARRWPPLAAARRWQPPNTWASSSSSSWGATMANWWPIWRCVRRSPTPIVACSPIRSSPSTPRGPARRIPITPRPVAPRSMPTCRPRWSSTIPNNWRMG